MHPISFKPDRNKTLKTCKNGRLERYFAPSGELDLVRVHGDSHQMGFAYGSLLGDRIRRNAHRLLAVFTDSGLPVRLVHLILDKAWQRLFHHVPQHVLMEMESVAQGARNAGHDVSLADLQRITTVTNLDLYKRDERLLEIIGLEGFQELGPDAESLLASLGKQQGLSCSMFAVWGSRTVDGKCFAIRNLDWLSKSGIHQDRLVTVYQPLDGIPFVTMGYAGVLGCLAGMNCNGVSLSEVGAFSVREELDGTPWIFMARRILEESNTLEDAVKIVQNTRHTIGYNYLVAYGDPNRFGTPDFRPCAAAFETNFDCCEIFYENDPKEKDAVWNDPQGCEAPYGIPLKEAVIRADTAFGKHARALQATDDGPGDPENTGNPCGRDQGGSSYTDCHLPMHDMILAYQTGAEYTFSLRNQKVIQSGAPTRIGPEQVLQIAATVAHGTEKLHENDWNIMSVVYAPTDLDFWVSFESCDESGKWTNAPGSGYWQFNLQELLDEPVT